MLELISLKIPGYEKVFEAIDSSSGLHAFISIHSTKLGPSLGGMRMYPYNSRDEALKDALRLSEAMTFKSALAGTGLGGGKCVIIGNAKREKTEALLLSLAQALNQIKGAYIAAEDVGTSAEDLLIMKTVTPFVAALPLPGSSGDPSRFTAFGVFLGLQAIAEELWQTKSLKGKKILIQGLGSVGSKLVNFLFWEGAELILSDLEKAKMETICNHFGAKAVDPKEIYTTPCDIFSPCAMGGILNKETIPLLKCKAVGGSTNNQLDAPEDESRLVQKGILHAPDYVINAGGIINASCEFLPSGYNPCVAREMIRATTYKTLHQIFAKSRREHKTPMAVANEMATQALLHPKST